MDSIETLIHNLAMAAWDAGCESGVVWCPDADMSKRGVVPMTQEDGLRDSREHFAAHGGGGAASEFDSALRALRRQLERRESPDWVTVREKWWTVAQILANAWRRHPLTCSERDKLVAEWDALRSGEAGKGKA